MNTVINKENKETKTADGDGSIPLSGIQISNLNPRNQYEGDVTSLAKDIDAQGLLQPVMLRRLEGGRFELIFGVRRFKALKYLRGEAGVIRRKEYSLVDLTEEQCIKAAVSENKERMDTSPLEYGRYFSNLYNMYRARGEKISDAVLAERTGEDVSRVNDLRALALKSDMLPQSWRAQLSLPPSTGSGKFYTTPAITTTHWKAVRGLVRGSIQPDLLEVMERSASEVWPVSRLEKAVRGLKASRAEPESDESSEAVLGENNATRGADAPAGAVAKAKPVARPRDPNAEHAYRTVVRGLKIACGGLGKDDDIAHQIKALLAAVEGLLKEHEVRANAEREAKKAEDAAKAEAKKAEKAAKKAKKAA